LDQAAPLRGAGSGRSPRRALPLRGPPDAPAPSQSLVSRMFHQLYQVRLPLGRCQSSSTAVLH